MQIPLRPIALEERQGRGRPLLPFIPGPDCGSDDDLILGQDTEPKNDACEAFLRAHSQARHFMELSRPNQASEFRVCSARHCARKVNRALGIKPSPDRVRAQTLDYAAPATLETRSPPKDRELFSRNPPRIVDANLADALRRYTALDPEIMSMAVIGGLPVGAIGDKTRLTAHDIERLLARADVRVFLACSPET